MGENDDGGMVIKGTKRGNDEDMGGGATNTPSADGELVLTKL